MVWLPDKDARVEMTQKDLGLDPKREKGREAVQRDGWIVGHKTKEFSRKVIGWIDDWDEKDELNCSRNSEKLTYLDIFMIRVLEKNGKFCIINFKIALK